MPRQFRPWYPPPSRPRPAAGIKARSRTGAIGVTWWSQRFISMLEAFDLGPRLARGRRYARAGQVLDLEVEAGAVHARVQGSRSAPYRVSIRVLPISGKDWARVEEALAARAVFLAKLLAGEMPPDIEEAFAACRLSLFPAAPSDLTTDCSCPDWANPCKHVAATYYLLAEAFDDDPFLILAWRGRTREELLDRLGGRGGTVLAGRSSAEGWAAPDAALPDLADCADSFYDSGLALPPATPIVDGLPADALLRELEDPPVEIRGHPLADVLRPAYAAMTEAARRRISGLGTIGPGR
ncbi:MAG: SWIM zinc finger family protein [Acidimicrobiia bacterium]